MNIVLSLSQSVKSCLDTVGSGCKSMMLAGGIAFVSWQLCLPVFAQPCGGGSQEQNLPFQGLYITTGLRSKCQYSEFTNVNPCEVKYYLQEQITTISNLNSVVTNYTSAPYAYYNLDDVHAYGIGYWDGGFIETYNATSVTAYENFYCSIISQTYSGSSSWTSVYDDYRTNDFDSGAYADESEWIWTDEHTLDVTTGTLTTNGWTFNSVYGDCTYTILYESEDLSYSDTNICSTNSWTSSTGYPYVDQLTGDVSLTQTVMTVTADPPPTNGSGTTVYTLSDEYTTCDLINNSITDLGAQSFAVNGNDWDPAFVIGDLESQQTLMQELDSACFWFNYQTVTNNSYLITKYFTVVSDGCSVGWVPIVTEVEIKETVNGDGLAHGETNFLTPLCANGFVGYQVSGSSEIMGGQAEITMVFLDQVTIQGASGSCTSGSCFVGGGQLQLRTTRAQADFGMGVTQSGQGVGKLEITTLTPNTSLATPQLLTLLAPSNLVTSITNTDGSLRQVGSSQSLVDIVSAGPYQYQIVFYATNALLPGHDNVTLISTNGLSPIVAWTIVNPDGATASNRFQVIESRGTQYTTNLYTYTGAQQWQLDTGNGLSRTLMTETWDSTLSNRTETVQVLDPVSGTVFQQTVSQYQMFPWGNAITNQTVGTGTNALTTTYAYYPETDDEGGCAGCLQQIIRGDGTWEKYYYNHQRQVTEVLTPFGNSDYFHEVQYNYTPWTDFGDDPTLYPTVPREISDVSFGVFNYFIAYSNVTIRIQVASTNGIVDSYSPFDVQSLCTTNWYYPAGDPNATRLQRVDHPDGTLDLYTYGTNLVSQTNIVCSGQASSDRTAVVDGTETISIYGSVGQLESRQVIDIASGITTSQETYSGFDTQGRPALVTYLDGTTVSYDYDCCNLSSMTDRNGLTTAYTYDALKRRQTVTQYVTGSAGITTTYTYDPAGNVLATTLTGTDGATIITNWSAGYDIAGRLIYQTNAMGGVTSYTYGLDASTNAYTTTVYPDLTTRTERHYRDGSLYQIVGTAVHGVQYDYGFYWSYTFLFPQYTQETKLNPDGTTTGEWEQQFVDVLGRPVRHAYADGNGEMTTYNGLGQTAEQRDADGVITLYGYDAKGEQTTTAKHADSGLGSAIRYSGTDRITTIIQDVLFDSGVGAYVQRSRTYVWSTNCVNASNLVSTTEASTNGLNSWNIVWNGTIGVTNQTVTSYASGGYRYESSYAPDDSYVYRVYQYGQLLSETKKNASGQTITQTSRAYDLFNRLYTSTDLRNGTTTYTYSNAGQVTGATTPSPGGGGSAQTTLTYYDSMQRATNVVNPDGSSIYTTYWPTGEILQQWGSRTYPLGYGYDYAGRMQTMTNWTDFASQAGARVTTWAYNGQRGWLTNKAYADGQGPTYSYTPAGRLNSRTWARGTNTAYTYNAAGDLATVIYNDGITAGITNGYDRLGRQTIVSNGPTVCTLTYNSRNQVLTESYTGGPLDGISVTNGYDSLLRRTNVATLSSGVITATFYGYDGISRLQSVSDGTNSATYGYLTNSSLVSQITFAQSGTTQMTTTKSYDYLNRLTSISSANALSVVLDSHGYAYNSANQRTAATNVDNSAWNYQYDSLGQVTSGKKYWSDGTVVAGEQFGYAFDDIGNRVTTQAGGSEFGANLRYANYSVNDLNQYTSRTVPGAVDIIGSATNTATVTVNDQPTYRRSNYYRMQLPLNNSGGAVWQTATNLAVLNEGTNFVVQTNITGNVFLPQTPENYIYDADGNLTQDGRWTYTWDAENRLINMASLSGEPSGSLLELNFAYDYKGRRVQKVVSAWTGSYSPQSTNIFVYDSWNLVSELNGANDALIRSYMWGMDLSGSMQGAGGVGGLLKIATNTANCFVAYDGNGNVAALADAASGTIMAQYEYDPLAGNVKSAGPMAKSNPFRFSTKYSDEESDLLYYGYRYLNTSSGRWLTRDPILEKAFQTVLSKTKMVRPRPQVWQANLLSLEYGFVGNDPTDRIDQFGLCDASSTCGADVTIGLIGTQTAVRKDYNNLSYWKQEANCQPWRGDWSTLTIIDAEVLWFRAMAGWDISGLTFGGWNGSCQFGGCGVGAACDHTVYLHQGNGCYFSWDVNYVLFGWMNMLCNNSQEHMDNAIWIYKHTVKNPKWPWEHGNYNQAKAFADAGYDGWPTVHHSIPSPPAKYGMCANCGKIAQHGFDSSWPHSDWGYIWW
jgi:RHS repeat-associated protein